MYKTVTGVLKPDGKIELSEGHPPKQPVKVLITFVDESLQEMAQLSELGDYLQQLEAYEELLAKGEIRWQ
jgi:predicted DNA-binding antitoxin AbrB/MazE fold protein